MKKLQKLYRHVALGRVLLSKACGLKYMILDGAGRLLPPTGKLCDRSTSSMFSSLEDGNGCSMSWARAPTQCFICTGHYDLESHCDLEFAHIE